MRLSQFLLKGALCLAAFAGAISAQSIAVLPGSQASSTSIPIFTASPLAPQTTATGVPAGASRFFAKPDGSKYYIITGSSGLTVLDRNFGTAKQILTSLNAAPRQALFSPDGKRLFMIIASQIYVLDTSTDLLLNSGNGITVTGTPGDLTFAHDGQAAFILSYGGFAAYVTRLDMTTLNVVSKTELGITANATGIVTAPNGLLYVSGTNGLFEINPNTMAQTAGKDTSKAATIPVDGLTPGKVQFTSDSQYAVALTSNATNPAVIFNVPNRTTTLVSSANLQGGTPDQLLIASDSRIFVHTTANQLFEMSLGGGFSSSPVTTALPSGYQVQSIAVSNQVQATTLYIDAYANGAYNLYRFDLGTNALLDQVALPTLNSQTVVWASGVPTSGAASVQALNNVQTVAAGSVSLPLVARVLDANGAPVFGVTVAFSVLNAGVTLSATAASTNYMGFAQVYATAGANSGTATVQAAVAGLAASTSYNITISGGGSSGGGCTTDCSAAGLFVYGGNGQIILEQYPANDLLMVIAKDANGNPVSGQQITFAITSGNGTTTCSGQYDTFPYVPAGTCTTATNSSTGLTIGNVATTDANGIAGVKFFATAIISGHSFEQTAITATSSTGSVTFYITTILAVLPNGGGTGSLPQVSVLSPQPDSSGYRIIRGTAGQTISNAIQVRVFASAGLDAGLPIPNVALNVNVPGEANTPNAKTTPSATCAGGTPLTDNTGTATCNLVMGPVVSSGAAALNFNVGAVVVPAAVSIVVSPNSASSFKQLQGNGQSGNAGAQFLLKAQVVDSSGSAVASVPVSWAVTRGTGTLSGQSTQSDSSGLAQATLTLGSTPGSVVVTLTGSPSGGTAFSTTFTLTVNPTVNGVTAVSGGGQTAAVGAAFSNPLVVKVTNSGGAAAPNTTVTFAVTSGSATLSAPTAVTDANGNASVTATAGTTAGPVVITASVGSQSASFSLTVRAAGPAITAASFINGASGAAGLTPCGIAIVSGSGLATGVQGTVQAETFGIGPLPTTLSGASLTINGVLAPIFWVSNTTAGGEAIAFETPCEVSAGAAQVVVTVNGGNTTVPNVPVTKYQPGVFTTNIGGKVFAVIQHVSDGSFVTPTNPANRGETLKVFLTGLGTGVPAVGTNKAGIGGQASDASPIVGINNGGVRTIGSEYLPGAIGIYTITFVVPADTTPGAYQPLGLFVTDPADATGTPIFALPTYLPIS